MVTIQRRSQPDSGEREQPQPAQACSGTQFAFEAIQSSNGKPNILVGHIFSQSVRPYSVVCARSYNYFIFHIILQWHLV